MTGPNILSLFPHFPLFQLCTSMVSLLLFLPMPSRPSWHSTMALCSFPNRPRPPLMDLLLTICLRPPELPLPSPRTPTIISCSLVSK